jgi:Domain of unknown function (DUF4148)
MKRLPVIALCIATLAADAAFASEPGGLATPLTRAQVRQSVLDARAAGELHFGDEPSYPVTRPRVNAGSIAADGRPLVRPGPLTPAASVERK